MKDFNENILIIISASSLVKFFGLKSDSKIDINYGLIMDFKIMLGNGL